MKPIKHILLLAALLLGSLAASAHDFEVGGIYYKITSETDLTVAVTYRGSSSSSYSGVVTIPSSVIYNGTTYSVTSIGNDAFYDCSSLTSITLPRSLTSIGEDAFALCSRLTDITLPGSLTSIGEYAFSRCQSLTAITIPEGVTSIGDWAFDVCSSLTSITLPRSLTSIGEAAFNGCHSLTDITIPEGVTSIGEYVFAFCYSLTSITLPGSLTSIEGWAFNSCSSLTSITCHAVNPPTIGGSGTFSGVDKSIPVYVPAGSVEAYKAAAYWSEFTNIQPVDDSSNNNGDSRTFQDWTSDNQGQSSSTSSETYTFDASEGDVLTFDWAVSSESNYDWFIATLNGSEIIKESGESSGTYQYTFTSSGSQALIVQYTKDVSVNNGDDQAKVYNVVLTTSSAPMIASGTCGDNLTWKLTEEYELVIEGTGDMYDYEQDSAPWYEYCHMINKVALPDGMLSIGNWAFLDCSSLTSITIPESVTSIGEHAFSDCSSFTSITIPESVTSIEGWAFLHCTGLTSITIPANVINIGYGILMGCNGLVSVVVEVGNPVYDSRYNCNAIIETSSNTLVGGCSITVIPNDITGIGNRAFGYCDFATISIPESVTKIEDCAFGGSSLTSITIPEGVTSIGIEAFVYCENLTAITIPSSVASIGSCAFNACYALTEVHISSIEAWCKISFSEYFSNPLVYAHNLYLNGELVTELVIPDGVTSIGDCAFCYCSSLTAITSETTTPPTIGGSYAFYGVDKSIPVYVPAGSVEAYKAAEYWKEFSNIQAIPSSDIASGTCGDNLTWRLTEEYELIIEGTGNMYDYASQSAPWFEYRESISAITIEEGVTGIGEYAFEECSGPALIYIPNGIRRIGECAFLNCDGLTAVHISSMETWCNIDFDGYFATPLYYARNLYLNGDLVTEVNIPNTLESVKDYTFYNCSALASVTIPEGITEIGSYAFYYCRSLTSVIVPEGVTVLESYTFQYCSSLESLSLPNSLQKISWSAISHCAALKTIILPKNVHAIESYAFDYTGLTSVIIPEGVSKISYATFSHCSSLASISIPSSVSLIEGLSLECCESLASITCHAVIPPAIGASNTFDGVDKSIPVYVPAGSVQAYKAAEYWSEFTNIQAISSDVASGTCGDNLTWRLTGEYELIIEGTGEMYDGSSWEGYEEAVKSITIGEGVTSIGDICFWNFSNLEVLTIPGSLTKIGGNPFYGCTELYTILLKSENPVYDIYDGNVVEKNSGTVVIGCRHVPAYSNVTKVGDFAYCGRGLSSIVIPESITSIGYAAFSENEDMTSITIPESVTSIGDHAFANCQKLTSVNIPEGVTKIGDWTFLQCYSLTSIEIPSSVTELGNLAFGLCESVTSITCMATNPPAAGNSFQGIDKSIPVYVPAGSVAAYKVANDWSEFTNILPIGEPEPATVTITINQYGSGTYSSEYALDFSEVMLLKAYVATGYNHLTGEVTLLRVHTAEAGTGLLVKGIPGMSYKVPILESTADHTLNMLVATLEKTPVNSHSDDGVYANYKYTVVKEQSPEPLFYQFADGASLSAGKAYLQIPVAWLPATGQRALRYRFDEGETTDIEETTANGGQSMVIYDLMGRRVLSPKKGEIYIINNKKVVY